MSEHMKVNDLVSTLHIANKLEQVIRNGEEIAQSLPPGTAANVYAVDEYPGCPNSWMNGSNIASSYFLGVDEEKGMWLNFNECVRSNHDVAVVVSIQGVNPITGQKMVGDNPLRLEKYHKQCPIHGIDFQQDRYCEECGFKWPAQNYIATTGTPNGLFWIDGFRNADGSVRQYVFTAEELEGVAFQTIGSDRVFAIGIAFYLSKEAKPAVGRGLIKRKGGSPQYYDPNIYKCMGKKQSAGSDGGTAGNWNEYFGTTVNYAGPSASGGAEVSGGEPIAASNVSSCCSFDGLDSLSMDEALLDVEEQLSQVVNDPDLMITTNHCIDAQGIEAQNYACDDIKILDEKEGRAKRPELYADKSVTPVTPVKKLEVGAGALIQQKIHVDPKEMDYWKEKPAGMIYMNYCDMETLKNILAKGRRKDKAEGFMEGLKVGG